MNFLEGLKRLFLIIALLVSAVAAVAGWEQGRPPYGCVDEATAKLAQQPGPWHNYKSDGVTPAIPCPPKTEVLTKRVVHAAVYSAAAALLLVLVWLVLRWVIVGFFPNATRRA